MVNWIDLKCAQHSNFLKSVSYAGVNWHWCQHHSGIMALHQWHHVTSQERGNTFILSHRSKQHRKILPCNPHMFPCDLLVLQSQLCIHHIMKNKQSSKGLSVLAHRLPPWCVCSLSHIYLFHYLNVSTPLLANLVCINWCIQEIGTMV